MAKHKNRMGKDPDMRLPCALAKAINMHIHVEIIIVAYACNVSLIITPQVFMLIRSNKKAYSRAISL